MSHEDDCDTLDQAVNESIREGTTVQIMTFVDTARWVNLLFLLGQVGTMSRERSGLSGQYLVYTYVGHRQPDGAEWTIAVCGLFSGYLDL